METEARRGSFNGAVSTVLDMIVAPRDAFEKIRATPTWFWAYLIAVVLTMAGTILMAPAVKHAMSAGLPAQLAAMPNIAKLPPDQQQAQIAKIMQINLLIADFTWLITIVAIPLIVVIQSLVMALANGIGKGDGTFRRFWSLGMNVAVPGGIGVLLTAFIVLIRGADSFSRAADVQTSMPNLGMLVPGGPHILAGFLSGISVIVLWQTALIGFGMIETAKIAKPVAWATAGLMLVTIAAFAAWGAVSQSNG